MRFDATDCRILEVLQERGRLANCDLADAIGLSETPCLRRVKHLEAVGAIVGYSARLDPKALGLNVIALVSVTLDRQAMSSVERFEKAIAGIPEVMDLYLVTGGFDYVLKLVAKDLEDFQRLVRGELLSMPWIAHLQSTIVMDHVLQRSALPLPDCGDRGTGSRSRRGTVIARRSKRL